MPINYTLVDNGSPLNPPKGGLAKRKINERIKQNY